MKVKLLYIDKNKEFSYYEQYLSLLSKRRQEKILRFHFDVDKKVSLLTSLLIRNEISIHLGILPSNIKFGYSEYGKPYVLNAPNYHFSVSHSGSAIVFVADSFPIGIDIEQIINWNIKVAKRFFTCNEYEHIISSKHVGVEFYKIWTSKEAYVKKIGLGLSKPFKSFDVLNGNLNCNFASAEISGYIVTVCSNNKMNNVLEINEVKAENFLNVKGAFI